MSNLLCAICRESLGVGSLNKSCTLPCGHVFHDHCIFNWLERSRTCPHCRISSRPDQVIKLYFDLSEDCQVTEIETLKNEMQRLKAVLEKTQTDYRNKSDDCKAFYRQLNALHKANDSLRKENKVLTNKVEKLKAVKLEYGRQKTELKMVLTVLEKERTKGVQLSKDIQKYQKIKTLLDGSLEESNSIINSEDSIDYDSMKICFVTMKRDFKNLTQAESKLKADYSSLFSLYKALEQTHSALVEKCSIQDRIIETYKADLKSSSNVTLPIEIPSESRMEVEEISLKTNPAKVMPRRSPRNLSKKSVFSLETKLTSTRQLTYDGLGGHSAEDKFPSAKLRPCRIVSNRRK